MLGLADFFLKKNVRSPRTDYQLTVAVQPPMAGYIMVSNILSIRLGTFCCNNKSCRSELDHIYHKF